MKGFTVHGSLRPNSSKCSKTKVHAGRGLAEALSRCDGTERSEAMTSATQSDVVCSVSVGRVRTGVHDVGEPRPRNELEHSEVVRSVSMQSFHMSVDATDKQSSSDTSQTVQCTLRGKTRTELIHGTVEGPKLLSTCTVIVPCCVGGGLIVHRHTIIMICVDSSQTHVRRV